VDRGAPSSPQSVLVPTRIAAKAHARARSSRPRPHEARPPARTAGALKSVHRLEPQRFDSNGVKNTPSKRELRESKRVAESATSFLREFKQARVRFRSFVGSFIV